MSNRAKRKRVAALLKQHGFGRLYRGRKFAAFRMLRGRFLNDLINKLSFMPGDVAHDCDGLNHRVAKWLPETRSLSSYWSDRIVGEITFVSQFEKTDGSWSCGCPYGPYPKASRESIEAFLKSYVNDPQIIKGGWVDDEYHVRMRDALARDEHVVDEDGMILPEFRRVK